MSFVESSGGGIKGLPLFRSDVAIPALVSCLFRPLERVFNIRFAHRCRVASTRGKVKVKAEVASRKPLPKLTELGVNKIGCPALVERERNPQRCLWRV